jgi:signal transduction histidine kinase
VSRSELDAIDHALRGGLNTTLLNLQLLANAIGPEAAGGVLIERARGEINRLAELLLPAALSVLALEIKRTERVDLRQLVTSTLPQHGFDRVVLSPGPSPTVSGDPDLLALALVHLTRNAVAATPEEGPPPRIDLGVGPGQALLRVTNACREAIPAVINGNIAGRRGHLGGLVIVTRVARLHGGALMYEVVDDQLVARLTIPSG